MEPLVVSTRNKITRQANGILSIPAMTFVDVRDAVEATTLDPPRLTTLMLELPHCEIGGKLTSWADVQKMSEYCRRHKIRFHCDGARIFEATAGYQKTLSELAEPFDSVYFSFYKGLGGMLGAMLLGSKDFCEQARIWLRRFGGNLYTLMPFAVSGWSGYCKNWVGIKSDGCAGYSFVKKRDKLQTIVRLLSSDESIGKVIAFDPQIPFVNMVHCYLKPSVDECDRLRDQIAIDYGIELYVRIRKVTSDDPSFREGFRSKLELSMGEGNGSVATEVFLRGWKVFAAGYHG
jgi:hypothetical protein